MDSTYKQFVIKYSDWIKTFISGQEITINNPSDKEFRDILVIFYVARLVSALESVRLLNENGLGRESPCIYRSAIEAFIRALHFIRNIDISILLHKLQMAKHHQKTINAYRISLNGKSIDSDPFMDFERQSIEDEKTILEEIEKIDIDLANKCRNNRNREKYWSGKDIKTMMNEINPNENWIYPICFAYSSDWIHSNIGTISDYFRHNGTKTKYLDRNNENTNNTYSTSIMAMILDFLKEIQRMGIYEIPSDLKMIEDEFKLITT
jgi:hypothetical protein